MTMTLPSFLFTRLAARSTAISRRGTTVLRYRFWPAGQPDAA
jgi:hypothetical protein